LDLTYVPQSPRALTLFPAAQKVLRELKTKISSQSKKNFVLEKDVRYLDSRIALLIQNRMALEEVRQMPLIVCNTRIADTTLSATRSSQPSRRRRRYAGGLLSQRRQDTEIWQSHVSAAVGAQAHCSAVQAGHHVRDRLTTTNCHVHNLRKSIRES
jgi:hypothetical protein